MTGRRDGYDLTGADVDVLKREHVFCGYCGSRMVLESKPDPGLAGFDVKTGRPKSENRRLFWICAEAKSLLALGEDFLAHDHVRFAQVTSDGRNAEWIVLPVTSGDTPAPAPSDEPVIRRFRWRGLVRW